MGFWDKVLKKKSVQSAESVQVQEVKTEVKEVVKAESKETAQKVQEPVVEKKYAFRFELTDKDMQQRIVESTQPYEIMNDVLNLELAYGVLETESQAFVTRVKSTQRRDANTGQTYYTTHFVLFVDGKCFKVSYIGTDLRAAGELTYDVPKEYEELAKQALDFWRDWPAHRTYEAALKQEGIDVIKLSNQLRSPWVQKVQEELNKPKEVVKQHFAIKDEGDARELFFLCDTDYRNKLKENYDEETVKNFEQYATSEKKQEWIAQECRALLTGIIEGDRDKLYQKLSQISGRCEYWISADGDDLADIYTQTCKVLFEGEAPVPVVCINSYLNLFTKRFNPLHVKELVDITEAYLRKNFAQEYEKGDYSGPVQSFKRLCAQLRGKIAELSPAENSYEFHFTETAPQILDTIFESYMDKYQDDATVKEELAYLNCAYGVSNEEIFLTAASEAVESFYNHSWDMYDFVAVLSHKNIVMDFRCKRVEQDGKLSITHSNGPVAEYQDMLMEAVAFFRNKEERELFFKEIEQKHGGANVYALRTEAHNAFFSRFPLHYEEELQRIGDNPMADTLKKLLELCEGKAHENGYETTKIAKPATMEEIEAWEQTHNMKLPESYCHFLCFANGVQLLDDRERLWSLNTIGRDDEYLEGYLSIGEMIGDGTTICLSKTTGNAYVEDHGEYEDHGDFKDFLEYFIDFLWDA